MPKVNNNVSTAPAPPPASQHRPAPAAVATQSLRQHHSSLYQQHTYLDRNHNAVTDVTFIQEHVSQSSWAQHHFLVPSSASFIGNVHHPQAVPNAHPHARPSSHAPPPPAPAQQPTYAYMPTYYPSTSTTSHAAYMYAARSSTTTSCNMGSLYMPHYIPTAASHPSYYYAAQQAQAPTGRQRCDAATQANLIENAPPLNKLHPESSSSSSLDSSSSSSSFSSSAFIDHLEEQPLVVPNEMESGAGDGIDSGLDQRRNSEVSLPHQRLLDITRISLHGSEIAEKLAIAHRNRPCFKKIDTLCARLKQDLLRPDGVLPNINSQGIAWAVKDFIFVFTRIINAWVILKGYVYNTPEGLNKIKDELPRGFMAVFDVWQGGTLALIDMIIKSFVNLDDLLQKQKNSFNKMETNNSNGSVNNIDNSSDSSNNTLSGTPLLAATPHNAHAYGPSGFSTPNVISQPVVEQPEPQTLPRSKSGINLNYLYTMIEDSEETQRNVDANGTYLKTGTYTPLKKEARRSYPKAPEPQLRPNPPPMEAPPLPSQCFQQWQTMKPTPQQQLQLNQLLSPGQPGIQQILFVPQQQPRQLPLPLPPLPPPPPPPQQQQRRPPPDVRPYLNPLSIVGREVARSLREFADNLMELQNTERFFQKQFTRNYYPDLYMRSQHEFHDVRTIILKCESVAYYHVYQAIHDMRRISFVVHNDLKIYSNEDLRQYIERYDEAVNKLLAKPPSLPHQFDHIIGRPGEKLFNYEI